MITNKGVNAFKVPARALFILVSAMQNKKAGKKLPHKADTSISPQFLADIFLMSLNATGNNITPAESMRNAAT